MLDESGSLPFKEPGGLLAQREQPVARAAREAPHEITGREALIDGNPGRHGERELEDARLAGGDEHGQAVGGVTPVHTFDRLVEALLDLLAVSGTELSANPPDGFVREVAQEDGVLGVAGLVTSHGRQDRHRGVRARRSELGQVGRPDGHRVHGASSTGVTSP